LQEFTDAFPTGLDGSFGGLAQQSLELGKDLLDRVGGRKNSLAPAERMARRTALPLWLTRLLSCGIFLPYRTSQSILP
jgi:hypothetical protein